MLGFMTITFVIEAMGVANALLLVRSRVRARLLKRSLHKKKAKTPLL